jgi:hypothetical protein
MDQYDSQCGWNQLASIAQLYIVTLGNIIDMHRYRGISANAVFLHQCDQLGFGEVVGWARLTFDQLHFVDFDHFILAERGDQLIFAERLPCHDFGETRIGEHGRNVGEIFTANVECSGCRTIFQIFGHGGQEMTTNVVVNSPCIRVKVIAAWKEFEIKFASTVTFFNRPYRPVSSELLADGRHSLCLFVAS